jgi:hypothetical protein
MYTTNFKPIKYKEAVAVKAENVNPVFSEEYGIYNGMPNEADTKKIESFTKKGETPEDWVIYSFNAIDNTVDLDWKIHTPGILKNYADRAAGCNFILNHEWEDVNSSVGFIIESQLFRCEQAPKSVLDKGISDFSKKIVKEEGYYWIFCKVAIRSGHPAAEALGDRRIQNCSIGGKLYDGEAYCPDCTQKYGQYVCFDDLVSDGDGGYKKACNHTALTPLHLWLYGYVEDDEECEEPNWSKGVIVDGYLKPVELTGCVQGMLPGAGVIRE